MQFWSLEWKCSLPRTSSSKISLITCVILLWIACSCPSLPISPFKIYNDSVSSLDPTTSTFNQPPTHRKNLLPTRSPQYHLLVPLLGIIIFTHSNTNNITHNFLTLNNAPLRLSYLNTTNNNNHVPRIRCLRHTLFIICIIPLLKDCNNFWEEGGFFGGVGVRGSACTKKWIMYIKTIEGGFSVLF